MIIQYDDAIHRQLSSRNAMHDAQFTGKSLRVPIKVLYPGRKLRYLPHRAHEQTKCYATETVPFLFSAQTNSTP